MSKSLLDRARRLVRRRWWVWALEVLAVVLVGVSWSHGVLSYIAIAFFVFVVGFSSATRRRQSSSNKAELYPRVAGGIDYDVTIQGVGRGSPLNTVKILRTYADLDAHDALERLRELPARFTVHGSHDTAANIVSDLSEIGAIAVCEPTLTVDPRAD